MKAIVFGGSGFLGSHVADVLSRKAFEVVIYDLKPSTYLYGSQKMIVGDVLEQDKVEKAVSDCDIVYNFAGISDIDESYKKPLDSVKSNIVGNAVILDACRKAKVKRFIFASSVYVYSKSGSFYRSSKQACELIIENYNEIYGLPYTILRYGSLYGPRSDERNFIHNILKQAVTKKKVVREGDGEEIREYIHVSDAAQSSVEILSDDFVDQCVIITGNQQMKVKDLLNMIKEMLDNRIEIEYAAPQFNHHYEITPYTFSPRLACRIMSKTYIDLGQGLLRCIHDLYEQESLAHDILMKK